MRLVDARPWTAAAYVADRYREGRAFLIGDAAHLMPPTGAFGGNTGIHDAHNLAWKLDAVIRGAAGPRLLETYDAERRPIAERTLAQALARLRAWFRDPERTLPETEPIVPDERVVFGYRYGGGAIVPDAGTGAVAFEDPRAAKATAGLRAPQLFVEHDGERKPILDLCDDGAWALFAGRDATDWCDAVRRSSVAQRLPVRVFQAGREVVELEQRWSDRYGVADSGAVLVRPDHVVAWRATERGSAAPAAVVGEVLAAVAG